MNVASGRNLHQSLAGGSALELSTPGRASAGAVSS